MVKKKGSATARSFGWLPLALPLVAYAATAFVIPTLAPMSIWDDWAYARSVEDLVLRGRLHFVDPVAVTLVFQTMWGALFSFIFGLDLGILRLSTVVLFGLSGLAFYGLCRQLGADRWWSAIGSLVYLFNPLAFLLSFTFMTDAPLIAMMTIAAYAYARALEENNDRLLILASMAAAAATLIRQPGILVPLFLSGYLVVTRQVHWSRRGLSTILRIAGIPVVSALIFYVWLAIGSRVPRVQSTLLDGMIDVDWSNIAFAMWGTLFRSALYSGLFTLALLPVLALVLAARWREVSRWGWFALLVVSFFVVSELSIAWEGAGLILVGDPWIGPQGLGPPDLVRGGRPRLASDGSFKAAVIVCAVSAGILVAALARSFAVRPPRALSATAVVAVFGASQIVGAFFPSLYWTAPWDRYLLPLSPFVIALAIRAVGPLKVSRALVVIPCLLIAAFSFTATRDFMVFEKAIWDIAERATARGVSNNELLSAAGRDAYYLFGQPRPKDILEPSEGSALVFWVTYWDLATTGEYVIATDDLPGYEIVERVEYSSWLHRESQWLYMLHAPPEKKV